MQVVSGPLLAAAALLAWGGAKKLAQPGPSGIAFAVLRQPVSGAAVRLLGVGEVALALWAGLLGGRLAAAALAAAYLAFAVVVARALRRGDTASCGCFGGVPTPPSVIHLVVNLAAAATAALAAATAPAGLLTSLGHDPAAAVPVVAAAAVIAFLAYVAVTALGPALAPPNRPALAWEPTIAERLADRGTALVANHVSRRSFLSRAAVVGAALTVAPADLILRPVSAYAAICGCSGQACNCGALCCDGYTEFCCTIYGANACPPGSIAAGWWKADGSGLCDVAGQPQSRYYIDCNAECDKFFACGCALGNCGHRKAGCTRFRYGQCHAEVACVGAIVCRVVTCTPPWQWDPACGTTVAVDNNTRFHNAPCLQADPGIAAEASVPGGAVVMGDWNGDGVRTPGIVANGRWYLRNSNSPGPADVAFTFGDPGDIPVVGDWDGDGVDTPGVVRQGRWYLRNSNSPGPADLAFSFGNPGDIPLAGDWDGDGASGPGVVRGSSWFLRDNPGTGLASVVFMYGSSANRAP